LLLRQKTQFNVVVITGAARGIGKHLAIQISSSCEYLLLIDKDNVPDLDQLISVCSSNGAKTYFEIADVRNRDDLQKVITRHTHQFQVVDLVIANAGVSPSLRGASSFEENLTLMNTNFFGVVNTFHCFSIPSSPSNQPIARKLVAISSIASLVATHNSGFYSASKSALSKYLDSLRLLNLKTDTQIHEIVCGFVNTRVNTGLKHANWIMVTPEYAAREILSGISSRHKRVHSVPRNRNRAWFVLKLLPTALRESTINGLYLLIYGRQG
jgi:short-subunit dehydrogenase